MKKHKKVKKIKIIIAIFILFIAITISVFGRYIYNGARELYLTSKQFYFSSDILKVNGAEYEYDNWGGVDAYPISFELYSYSNKLSRLNYDLNYTVTCESLNPDKIDCKIGNVDGEASKEGTIYVSNDNTERLTIYVKPKTTINEGETVKIRISATTKEPYKKTISCEISLNVKSENISYSIEDTENKDYAILKIVNGNSNTTRINVKFDSTELRLDSNDEIYQYMTIISTTMIDGKEYISEAQFNLPKESSKNIKFYKVDKTKNYFYPKGSTTSAIAVNGITKLEDINRIVIAQNTTSTSKYLNSSVEKSKIETIKFELGKTEPKGTVSSFDASENQDNSIMGYYTDTDNNGLYELTFLSLEPIGPNENAQYLFQNMSNLTGITFDNFNTYGVTNMNSMFLYCTRLAELDLSGFDTSQVENMGLMFYGCNALSKLNLNNFNTEKVTKMTSMFLQCYKLEELDLSSFNTSQVTDMSEMFSNCGGLTELDVSNFDTSQVTNMKNMFFSCSKLITINISGFNTSKVTNMGNMFRWCYALTTIYVKPFDESTNSGWTTSAVTTSSYMFNGSTKLVGGNGTTYNSSYQDKTYARIDEVGTPGYFTSI